MKKPIRTPPFPRVLGALALATGLACTAHADDAPTSADDALGGNKASPLLGLGAEYQVDRHIGLTFDLDGYGQVSDKVKAATATVGARLSF